MANQEHLDIFNQGVEAWNRWRKEYPDIRPNLAGANILEANFRIADLRGANFSDTNLRGATLLSYFFSTIPFSRGATGHIGANLSEANFRNADLFRAYLWGDDLSDAILLGANLGEASLGEANLRNADLSDANLTSARLNDAILLGANLTGANLSSANLSSANLSYANFSDANLRNADLSESSIGWTIFGNVNLGEVKGLETVKHKGPSTIGIDTIYQSKGDIPEVFLKGTGVDDTFITYIRSLIGKPIEYYSCFISYSSKDQDFAEHLYADLQRNKVRCWFAPENLKIGDRIRDRIDESIHLYDKLLLILSEDSMESEWVEDEVEAAMERERREGRTILFPVRLDDTVKTTSKAWAAKLRRQRNIGDFTHWKDHDAYQKAFDRLLRDLKAEAQKMGSRDVRTNNS